MIDINYILTQFEGESFENVNKSFEQIKGYMLSIHKNEFVRRLRELFDNNPKIKWIKVYAYSDNCEDGMYFNFHYGIEDDKGEDIEMIFEGLNLEIFGELSGEETGNIEFKYEREFRGFNDYKNK